MYIFWRGTMTLLRKILKISFTLCILHIPYSLETRQAIFLECNSPIHVAAFTESHIWSYIILFMSPHHHNPHDASRAAQFPNYWVTAPYLLAGNIFVTRETGLPLVTTWLPWLHVSYSCYCVTLCTFIKLLVSLTYFSYYRDTLR